MFTFDDADENIYTNAFPILSGAGKTGTFYVITGDVGSGPSVTWAQLQEMEVDGWSIANHTRNHTDLTTLSQADAQTEIEAGKSDLIANGITNAVNHLAYPGGAYNATVVQAAIDAGMVTQRRVTGGSVFELDHTFAPSAVPITKEITSGDSLADLKVFVDNAVAAKKIASFLIHSVPGDISIADLGDLVDYCKTKGCRFLTIEDIYSNYLSN